jgi:diaminohydroxyphosphoribosylaminopyrimidine deaminase/5-amino-6-(5-phosphoribosylamino)uracil reductase
MWDWDGNPVRIVLDQNSRLQKEPCTWQSNQNYCFTKTTTDTDKENLTFTRLWKNIATQMTDALYDHQIQSVIIEGGRQTLQTFIDANLWDEARVLKELYTSKKALQPQY